MTDQEKSFISGFAKKAFDAGMTTDEVVVISKKAGLDKVAFLPMLAGMALRFGGSMAGIKAMQMLGMKGVNAVGSAVKAGTKAPLWARGTSKLLARAPEDITKGAPMLSDPTTLATHMIGGTAGGMAAEPFASGIENHFAPQQQPDYSNLYQQYQQQAPSQMDMSPFNPTHRF